MSWLTVNGWTRPVTPVNWEKFYCNHFVLNGHLILELIKQQITLLIMNQKIIYLNNILLYIACK